MATQIVDAATGNKAKVNANQRLYTQTVSIDENLEATKTGRSFNINTGVIEITSAAESAVCYVKNNEEEDLHITAIAVGVGPTTGGSGGIPKIVAVRNPTTGTIIDDASAVDINSNRNYGSSETLDVDAYKGATGKTFTNGEDHLLFFQGSGGRLFATIDEVIPKGKSIGIKFTSQPSNTSQNIYIAIVCHTEDPNE